jgi:hypothetical protein
VLSDLHADRLVVDEGLVRPSESCTRRRINSSSAECRSALSTLARDDCAWSSNAAVTWPCSAPWRTRPARRGPERQRESVEQDRLAGAGLAGEHRETAREVDVEPVDQHDVADRERESMRESFWPPSSAKADEWGPPQAAIFKESLWHCKTWAGPA